MTIERTASFQSRYLNIVGTLRIPTPANHWPHADLLANEGFVTLAFDTGYQGESSGEPRGLEDPSQRVEDIKAAVTSLSLLDEVDAERIGVLGICASGGYASFAAQTDVRIKAIAGVSTVDPRAIIREGVKRTAAESSSHALAATLKNAANARLSEAKSQTPQLLPWAPDDPRSEAAAYYWTSRGAHRRSTNRSPLRSTELLANFDAFAFNYLISPRPILMIAGSEADTRYHSENAIAKVVEPKELFLVPNKSHIAHHDDPTGVLPMLVDFYANSLST
ncbi:alpha/beta-hydrolase [Aspergillus granulosus]|uniref:Alpha/beta-hydrolase n=1 Tax=Aspergillus granulosus TaxID=176169 RepID=A0ABR4HSW5_9EURO